MQGCDIVHKPVFGRAMKWRRKPARPVLAESRAKHKANSQSLSEASNNESANTAFMEKHHRGVARKTFRSGEGGLTPSLSREATDRHKCPCRIARPRQGVVPRNEDWQCPPTATAVAVSGSARKLRRDMQKEHVRAAGLTRRGATRPCPA